VIPGHCCTFGHSCATADPNNGTFGSITVKNVTDMAGPIQCFSLMLENEQKKILVGTRPGGMLCQEVS
jgi:hypothetical protein